MDYKQRSAARRATPYLYIVRFDHASWSLPTSAGVDSRTLTVRRPPSAKVCHFMLSLCEM
ncbi:hypothetical protein M407DRAFT_243437 [Tulasnella calospora MUT 4182]|uniref:Uncharacterized protein n=1 Tax=Tulasnella calospora MUT 4182 TaxID=1051891 RepID=A0A0C3M0K8_9AGAM|nr:hypothetical protein M407DRAFT_243437 [Tulasnella calospora MUT 4182]